MSDHTLLERHARYLMLVGIAMFLFTSLWGFVVPAVASQRVALSVHTLSGFQGLFLIAQGLLWPRLHVGRRTAWVAFLCSLHGTFAILAAYVFAAVTGYGRETLALVGELPHGLAYGPALQETIVKILGYQSAPTGIAAYVLIFWGLLRKNAGHEPGAPAPED